MLIFESVINLKNNNFEKEVIKFLQTSDLKGENFLTKRFFIEIQRKKLKSRFFFFYLIFQTSPCLLLSSEAHVDHE